MLADRLAVFVASHEPGWRVPQRSMLARRFGASEVEIDYAVGQLVANQLVRVLPDGRLYRSGPADYLIGLEGLPGPSSYIDPMGAVISCSLRHVSWRRLPDEVGLMLGLPPAAGAAVIRCQWTANGRRAALTTTYLPAPVGSANDSVADSEPSLQSALNQVPVSPAGTTPHRLVPAAVHVEIQPPTRAGATYLDLKPGSPAITVAVRFDDRARARPAALTIATLRADTFRVVLDSSAPGIPPLDGTPLSSLVTE